jgi:L-fuculose-phosphate aldolase
MAPICHRIYMHRLSPATAGNVSIREGDTMWITPSGCCLGEVQASDMVAITMEGLPLDCNTRQLPSTEWPMHAAIYHARPDIHAVIHAHPPKATALAVAHRTLDQPLLAELICLLGDVPLVPYRQPGSHKLADAVRDAVSRPRVHAMILANHGVMTTGTTLQDAFLKLELLENAADIFLWSQRIPGGPVPLSPQQVAELQAAHHP